VLLLHRSMDAATVLCGIERALVTETFDPEVVAIEARSSQVRPDTVEVINPTLAVFDRPTPSLARYDDLLGVG
jgi:hypothetical protein